MIHPEFLVVHSAASKDPTVTSEIIRQWHLERGFSDIGYHYVILRDGQIELGRPTTKAGAHTKGLNSRSIGICLVGHGDHAPPTHEQLRALVALLVFGSRRWKIPVSRIIGHREINNLLPQKYHTTKTCPGAQVDLDDIRTRVRKALGLFLCQG